MVATGEAHVFWTEWALILTFWIPFLSLVWEFTMARRCARCCGGVGRRRPPKALTSPTDASAVQAATGCGCGCSPPGSVYPLTPAQLEAAKLAAEQQQAVVDAANRAPREAKEREDPKWKRNGGRRMEELLPDTHLVDAQYLVFLADAGGILPPCEEVPKCALLDAKCAWRLRTWPGFSSLSALVLSWPWLDPEHPDKHAETLQSLVPVLVAMIEAAQGTGCEHSTVGVYIEYSCMPGSNPSVASQRNRMRWFAHPCTHVLLLNAPFGQSGHAGQPGQRGGGSAHAYSDTRSFDRRGWNCVEERAACLVKYSHCLWEMARYVGGDTYEALYKALPASRKPLTSPPRLQELLVRGGPSGNISFPEAEDVQMASKFFEAAFIEAFETFHTSCPGRTNLFFRDAAWGAEEAALMAEALEHAARHCTLKRELTVNVSGGSGFAEAAGTKLHEAVAGTALRIK